MYISGVTERKRAPSWLRVRNIPFLAVAFILSTYSSCANALVIDPIFDSSITSRSNAAQIEAAFGAAATQFEHAFDTPVTVRVDVSWGAVGGEKLGSGLVGGSQTNLSGPYSFAQLAHVLKADSSADSSNKALASLVGHLPASGPTHLNQFEIPYAEAQALGLLAPNLGIADASVGFSSTASFDFSESNGISPGQYDFVGAATHELEEALGRISGLTSALPSWGTPLDLARYAAAGAPSFSYGAKAYFSIDGGKTNLGDFNFYGYGDRSDWLSAGTTDLQAAYLSTAKVYRLSASDLTALAALGWGAPTLPANLLTAIPGSAASGLQAAGGAPEPDAWMMFTRGVGLAGAAVRRRRSTQGSAALPAT
jgi:hypothetical protein